jgi:hypothetical protein
MKIKLRNAMLVALGIAGTVGFSGLSGEARESPPVATKTDRLPVPVHSSADYFTVQLRLQGVSVLCRLPIQIANWNITRPSRCN